MRPSSDPAVPATAGFEIDMRLQRAERLSETCPLAEGLFLPYRHLSFSPYHNNISRDKHFCVVIIASFQDDDIVNYRCKTVTHIDGVRATGLARAAFY